MADPIELREVRRRDFDRILLADLVEALVQAGGATHESELVIRVARLQEARMEPMEKALWAHVHNALKAYETGVDDACAEKQFYRPFGPDSRRWRFARGATQTSRVVRFTKKGAA